MCGGSDTDPASIGSRLSQDSADFFNFDLANGPQFDFADDAVWDQLRYDVAAGRYSAALAFPDLSTYSHHHMKTGHKPYRSAEGPGRYKLKGLSLEIAEKLRLQNLVAVRIAEVLNMFLVHQLPFLTYWS